MNPSYQSVLLSAFGFPIGRIIEDYFHEEIQNDSFVILHPEFGMEKINIRYGLLPWWKVSPLFYAEDLCPYLVFLLSKHKQHQTDWRLRYYWLFGNGRWTLGHYLAHPFAYWRERTVSVEDENYDYKSVLVAAEIGIHEIYL